MNWAQSNLDVSHDALDVQAAPGRLLKNGQVRQFVARRVGAKAVLHRCGRNAWDGMRFNSIICGSVDTGVFIDLRTMQYTELRNMERKDPTKMYSATIGKCTQVNG